MRTLTRPPPSLTSLPTGWRSAAKKLTKTGWKPTPPPPPARCTCKLRKSRQPLLLRPENPLWRVFFILTECYRSIYYGYMKTVISVKVDKDVRDRARKVSQKVGVPLSIVVNASLRKFVEEERVVIESERAYRMTKKFEQKLRVIEADIKAGRNLSPAFTSAKDAIAWLNAK